MLRKLLVLNSIGFGYAVSATGDFSRAPKADAEVEFSALIAGERPQAGRHFGRSPIDAWQAMGRLRSPDVHGPRWPRR